MIATVCLAEFRRWNPVILIGNCTAGSFVGWKFPTAELTQVQIMQIQRMEGARFENYFCVSSACTTLLTMNIFRQQFW